MPSKAWLKKRYAHLPQKVQLVLINKLLNRNVRILSNLLNEYPKVHAVHSSLENGFIGLGSRTLAIRKWHKTVKSFPRIPNTYFQRASWALEKSKFFEAALYLRLCLKVDKGYFKTTAHFWRAEALYRLGNYSIAKRELNNVPNEYEELYFLNYKKRSKMDLLNDICAKENYA